MLFNSFEFIFLFLPVTLAIYFICSRWISIEAALGSLVLSSLLFYGYWKPIYLLLILFSITFNYLWGRLLTSCDARISKLFLICGVTINLALLAYFKYAIFFFHNVNAVLGTQWNFEKIFLPLAISFFTFQQISYLVDTWQGKTREYNFLHYSLFVCFFPQLIAGPIVHHREMLPQFLQKKNLRPQYVNFAIGLSIFALGLFKKTVIADNLAAYVWPVYDNPASIDELDLFAAWGSTLAYTFQLYFDFSGYSDMAVGCARLFGIKLPINFFSPYKSTSIIEFWRRWHITLSRFLRDYLYIALGGSRNGKYRRYVNLFLTMLLGGLWHGAGWTFIIWGGLQGGYLMINHTWRKLFTLLNLAGDSTCYKVFSWSVTFVAVVVSWVYFRAPTVEQANGIILAMLGANGASLPAGIAARLGEGYTLLTTLGIGINYGSGSVFISNYIWVFAAGIIAITAPNVTQIFHRYDPVLYERESSFRDIRSSRYIQWNYSVPWASLTAIAGLLGVLTLTQVSEFLYFQF